MVLRMFLDWFWNSDVWLPPGIDWKDLVSTDKLKYPVPTDLLYYPIPIAILLIFVRYFIERFVFYPLGQYLGLKNVIKSGPVPNPVLEKAFHINGKSKFSHKDIEALSKRTDLEVRQVERWMRQRKARDKPSTLAKFSESGWRFTCYTFSLILGLVVLWNKNWFGDINHCWYDYPHHSIPDDIWWYYVYGSSFYWSLLITQAFDVKRKDFWEMCLHHLITICLLLFSWFCNLTRMGTLVLLLHDCADVVLEAAKMTNYLKYEILGNILFAVFSLVWIFTRLGVFSTQIIHSTLFEAPKIIPMFAAYYIFNGMLIALLCLHVFWTYFIFKIVYKAIASAKIQDARSSSESCDDDEDDDVKKE